MVELRNEQISIVVAEKGAELQSIKDAEGNEYLWQGDPKYWPRRSPILFPLVCSVENDTYRVDGKEYHLPRHGFARDMDFTLIRQGEDRATFALHESEETLKVYPFCFNLAVTYRLDGNKIHVIWHVENTDKRDIHFQIGGHPAFNVPGMKEGEQLQGCITLDNKEPLIGLKNYIDGSHEMVEVPVEAEYGPPLPSASARLSSPSGVPSTSMLPSCASSLGTVWVILVATMVSSRTSPS